MIQWEGWREWAKHKLGGETTFTVYDPKRWTSLPHDIQLIILKSSLKHIIVILALVLYVTFYVLLGAWWING